MIIDLTKDVCPSEGNIYFLWRVMADGTLIAHRSSLKAARAICRRLVKSGDYSRIWLEVEDRENVKHFVESVQEVPMTKDIVTKELAVDQYGRETYARHKEWEGEHEDEVPAPVERKVEEAGYLVKPRKTVKNPGERHPWHDGNYALLANELAKDDGATNAEIARRLTVIFGWTVTENAIKGAKYRLVRRKHQSVSLDAYLNTYMATAEEKAAWLKGDPALEHHGAEDDGMTDYWFRRFSSLHELRAWLEERDGEFDVDEAFWVTLQWDVDGGPNAEVVSRVPVSSW